MRISPEVVGAGQGRRQSTSEALPPNTKNRKKRCPFLSFFSLAERLLAVMLIRNGQLLAPFCTAGSQHATAVLGGHSLAEAVFVHPSAIVGLECSFHF